MPAFGGVVPYDQALVADDDVQVQPVPDARDVTHLALYGMVRHHCVTDVESQRIAARGEQRTGPDRRAPVTRASR